MSTSGVRSRFVSLLAASGGVVTKTAYQALID